MTGSGSSSATLPPSIATSFASDGDAVRDRLRYAVLDAAMDFARTPCDVALKAVYIKAAINYTHAWHRATGCKSFTSCNASGAQFDKAAAHFHEVLERDSNDAEAKQLLEHLQNGRPAPVPPKGGPQ